MAKTHPSANLLCPWRPRTTIPKQGRSPECGGNEAQTSSYQAGKNFVMFRNLRCAYSCIGMVPQFKERAERDTRNAGGPNCNLQGYITFLQVALMPISKAAAL